MPDWIGHVVWWHVYPLGFVGAEGAAGGGGGVTHRLARIVEWLDYAVQLGVSGIALGPIFASMTHGYDTVDHFRIDPRLGDDDDFDRLVSAAHERGLRLLLDGVFNHVGPEFPPFARTIEEGASAPGSHWFSPLDPAAEGRTSGPAFRTFEGHEGLIALNHDEPTVADYVTDVMRHWLARGADGWRLDAAYAVPRAFWAQVVPRVRADFPDAYVVGEVIHGDYSAIVSESGLDAVTQYELWKAIWSSLNDANFHELAWALKRHNALLDTFVPLTFVGNHDVTRLASKLDDERHLGHALVVLLTVAGTPSVYYGDEQAFRGVKEDRVGGDDAIRPSFPPDGPGALAPYGWPVYRLHQQLIGLRRRHPWLHGAAVRPIHLTNTALVYESVAGEDRLVTVLNIGDAPVSAAAPAGVAVLAGSATIHANGPGATNMTVAGHEWAIVG
ncbi:MAG: cyclomaltodextrinase / maltogenic alpha-amylase / neopullulanase [Solirubrobacteraceae bacterium]|jgi:cyclomaltodextrinase|nr:cyclomaltodextrinase / maltogenic alpha-amylase / neopullulanase [Solirubrobacteraceae bacterium]